MPSPQNPSFADFSELDASSAPALHQLHRACFSQDEVWTEGAFQAAIEEPSHWGVVQFDQQKSALGLSVMRTIADECELLTIAVHPENRGEGLAAGMLAQVIHEAAAAGLMAIHLEVAEDNPGALRLYENGGFQKAGRRPGYYRRSKDQFVDAILMTKTL